METNVVLSKIICRPVTEAKDSRFVLDGWQLSERL
jgi:hypothetical protein